MLKLSHLNVDKQQGDQLLHPLMAFDCQEIKGLLVYSLKT